jgi:hypothetical protein
MEKALIHEEVTKIFHPVERRASGAFDLATLIPAFALCTFQEML